MHISNEKQKNNMIELYRICFCLMIFIYHGAAFLEQSIFPNGHIAVEFFFFLSGAFAMKHVIRHPVTDQAYMKYSAGYVFQKMKRIFPYAAIGTIVCYGFQYYLMVLYQMVTPANIIYRIKYLPYELLFLPMTGIMPLELTHYANAPLWYISSMMITLPIVVYLMTRFSDVFRYFIAFIVPFYIHGWMIANLNGVTNWGSLTPLGYSGNIRAFADLCLGAGIYLLSQKLMEKDFEGKKYTVIFSVLEIGCFLFILYVAHSTMGEQNQYGCELATFAMALMLIISLSGQSITSNLKGNIWGFLGKLSLPVYALHWGMNQIVQAFELTIPGYIQLLGSILICFVLAMLIDYLIQKRKN